MIWDKSEVCFSYKIFKYLPALIFLEFLQYVNKWIFQNNILIPKVSPSSALNPWNLCSQNISVWTNRPSQVNSSQTKPHRRQGTNRLSPVHRHWYTGCWTTNGCQVTTTDRNVAQLPVKDFLMGHNQKSHTLLVFCRFIWYFVSLTLKFRWSL